MKNVSLSTKLAIGLLLLAGVLAYAASWDDTAIVDEDPHIGAGISYVTQQDMRLNPEHPPLVKDLAALPLVFIPHLHVPTQDPSWTDYVNGQWDFGRAFLFQSGNNADLILRLARLTPLGIMLLAGWFVFRWSRERYGSLAASVGLLAFSFSPVVLAHGHYVTTDVPAAAGVLIASYYFIRYLKTPTRKNLVIAGIVFGLAQLTKFSVVLLIPFFAIASIGWWLLESFVEKRPGGVFKNTLVNAMRSLGGTVLIGSLGLVVIYIVYAFHVWHYPQERQLHDMTVILSSFPSQMIAHIVTTLAGIGILRPLAQYFFGIAMVFQRATGGNTTYFLGEVSASGWKNYFPLVYLIKLPVAFHLFTILAILMGIRATFSALLARSRAAGVSWLYSVAAWKREHFPEIAMLLFLAIYWYTSLTSNLNIGVRHLMPTLPFIAILIAAGVRSFFGNDRASANVPATLRTAWEALAGLSLKTAAVLLLVLWMASTAFTSWPSYLSSFNEIAGGPKGGVQWVVDSNLDWGQDLKRLTQYVDANNIKEIAVDYFGWTPPVYYIKNAQVIPWSSDKGQPSGWFAISATYRQQSCAKPAPGFNQSTTGYCFLWAYKPEAVIGNSIFVYHLP